MAALSDTISLAIDQALAAPHGRHAEILVNDGPLRQTVIALKKGVRLAEHNSPPAASIQVIRGVLQVSGDDEVVIQEGHVEALTHQRHAVEALENTVFLLTTVTSIPGRTSHTGQIPVVDPEV